jgi:hypothetical protein
MWLKGIPMKNDAENIRIIEQYRPKYETLRTSQIKVSAELDHLENDIQAQETAAVEMFGTSDQEGMEQIVADGWADNTAVAKEFVDLVDEIDAEFRRLAGAPDQVAISRPQAPPSRVPPQR